MLLRTQMQRLRVPKRNLFFVIVYFLSIGITASVVERINYITGSNLVSDEGVFLAYSHFLASQPISGIGLEHINGYGTFYWIQCFLLVFPASILNRLGIDGVESLRIVVWACGLIVFLYLIRTARLQDKRELLLICYFFCLFPVGSMIRFFGLKDMVTASALLLVIVTVKNEFNDETYKIKRIQSVVKLTAICTILFFIQNSFIPIIALAILITATIKKSVALNISALILFLIYTVLNFFFKVLQDNDEDEIFSILPTEKVTSLESSQGGTFIPKSAIKLPEDFSFENNKILHLFYFNLDTPLSILVTIEGLAWLTLICILALRLMQYRQMEKEKLFVVAFPLLSFFGVLFYDENFGTFLRHRSSLLPVFFYAILVTQKIDFRYGKFFFLRRGHKIDRKV